MRGIGLERIDPFRMCQKTISLGTRFDTTSIQGMW